ncbi:hypothetical protein [Nocardia brasiliensis]|nr:hypothetical protein [Nocardia brasiliensis]
MQHGGSRGAPFGSAKPTPIQACSARIDELTTAAAAKITTVSQ